MTGGAIVVRALEDEGIPFAFGIPGTHNIELYDALAESKGVRPVLVTDEQSASFMADAVWRASGKLACVNVVPGAGLTHALSGIAEAFLDNVAMLVLGCGIRRDTGRAFQLHDVDQIAMVRPVTKGQFLVERGADLYPTIRRACGVARGGAPGPVFVEIAANLYLFKHDAAFEALVRLAERLEAPVATTFQGKGVFPESHRLALWPGFGDAAPPFAREVARECDATLAIGCRFGEVATASYGLTPPRPLVRVDIDPAVFGRNYPAEATIAGDAAGVVPALLDSLAPRPPDADLRARILAGREDVWREWTPVPGNEFVAPFHLLRALQEQFGSAAVFTSDSGNGTFLAMELLRLDAPRKFLAPVDYSCMGCAVPAAIGAKLARPECPVVALAGDGAFLMTGLELLTAAHLGVPVAVFVLRDRALAQIAQFQAVAMNRLTCSELPDFDLQSLCSGLGIECLRLDGNAAVAGVLERAAAITAEGRPVVVDTAIDYSMKTYFTRGVVKTNLGRLPWPDRLRFVARAVGQRLVP